MQWNGSENAGFTTGTPWIGVADNYRQINAAAEMDDPDSVRSFYKTLVHLRKTHKAISEGKIEFLSPDNADLLAYHWSNSSFGTRIQESTTSVFNLPRWMSAYAVSGSTFNISAISKTEYGRLRSSSPGGGPLTLQFHILLFLLPVLLVLFSGFLPIILNLFHDIPCKLNNACRNHCYQLNNDYGSNYNPVHRIQVKHRSHSYLQTDIPPSPQFFVFSTI